MDDCKLDPPLERCPERISIECYQGDCASCDWDGPDACLCEHHALAPQVICAWCKIVMREGSLPASHGICQYCELRWIPVNLIVLIIPYFLL